MEIVYFGHSCFRIKTKNAVLVTDPFDESVGLPVPDLSADVVTVSHPHLDHANYQPIAGTERSPEPFVISGPGEYEVAQIYVWGLSTFHDEAEGRERGRNTIYFIQADGLRLCHLGDLGHQLSDKMAEKINQTDVLMIPVGGSFTLDAAAAAKVVEKINPSYVVPMHYLLPGTKIALAPVEAFLEKMGAEGVSPILKLNLKPETLPEEREIVVLSPQKKI